MPASPSPGQSRAPRTCSKLPPRLHADRTRQRHRADRRFDRTARPNFHQPQNSRRHYQCCPRDCGHVRPGADVCHRKQHLRLGGNLRRKHNGGRADHCNPSVPGARAQPSRYDGLKGRHHRLPGSLLQHEQPCSADRQPNRPGRQARENRKCPHN